MKDYKQVNYEEFLKFVESFNIKYDYVEAYENIVFYLQKIGPYYNNDSIIGAYDEDKNQYYINLNFTKK